MRLLQAPRWARFVGMIEEIDASVQQASYGKPTAYSKHIGATWYVSVDEKFPTVDVRRWYLQLEEVINKLNEQMPAPFAVSPCWHDSQIDEMLCNECTPFSELDNVDVKAAEAATSLHGR